MHVKRQKMLTRKYDRMIKKRKQARQKAKKRTWLKEKEYVREAERTRRNIARQATLERGRDRDSYIEVSPEGHSNATPSPAKTARRRVRFHRSQVTALR